MTIDTQSSEWLATLALIEAFLEAEQKTRKFPGLSVAIVYDQEILWTRGFGFANIEQRIPATAQTICRVASVTKLFTATMLMQLRDAEKLHLDEPIEKYLPEFKVKSCFADSSPITFRQVVAHLSGLPRDDSVDRVYEESRVIFPSIEELQASLKQIELIAAPMTKKVYSNLGFAILGLALGQIAGQHYTEYVTEHILSPLGMQSSGFEPTDEWSVHLQTRLASPYKPQLESETAPTPTLNTIERGMNPAGGLFSSVEDMARFISLQFLEGPVGGKQILKGTTLREMHAPVFLDPNWNEATGISWLVERIQNHTAIGHSGGLYGFSTDVLIVPALKLGLALFINTATDANRINRSVLEFLSPTFNHLLQLQQTEETSVSLLPPTQSEWARYEGRYTEPGMRQSFEVHLKPDRLVVVLWGTEVTLLPQEEHRFRMQGGPFDGEFIHFVPNNDNIIVHARTSGLMFVRE